MITRHACVPPLLTVHGFHAGYGKVEALTDAALRVDAGSIVTVIGPNGAGKSTLLNAIMGLVRSRGELHFDGQDICRKSVEARVVSGLALVPEQRALFADMTVLDNLRLGSFRRYRAGRTGHLDEIDWVYELFPRLKERSAQLAGTLSGGERQMLALGRALMSKPVLLMLDEPSLGLAPRIVAELLQVVGGLRAHGVSTLLVEQNARAALQIADRGYVLENGRIVLEGSARDLEQNPRVIESYLGLSRRRRGAVPAQPAPEPA